MTPEQFRERFNDMSAGSIGWSGHEPVVVACKVYDTFAHEAAWLATAAEDRSSATGALKSVGVHGLKFKKPSSTRPPDTLVYAARSSVGSVVAMLPDDSLVVLTDAD